MPILKEARYKQKSSKGLGMETDQTEQLDVFLNQPIALLNKNCDTEERPLYDF